MYSWNRVKKRLGPDHPRIVYLEQQLSRLIDQSDDLAAEIDSLVLIANDVRPVMSPDKTFELAHNEASLLAGHIGPDELDELKVRTKFNVLVYLKPLIECMSCARNLQLGTGQSQ